MHFNTHANDEMVSEPANVIVEDGVTSSFPHAIPILAPP